MRLWHRRSNWQVTPPMPSTANVTAIVTAFDRIDQTIDTVARIKACTPPPDEVVVHVDGGRIDCADAVRRAYPDVGLIVSTTSVGPGGGRNKLVAAARNELIASFDDDSYPMDRDFFARVVAIAEVLPNAALYSASIVHIGEGVPADARVARLSSSFGAGGAVFCRTQFLSAGGFVPLVVAYGMEEEDLALRLIDSGWELIHSPWLRVFHDTDRSNHASARITAGAIANLALLAWLRYPPRYWPYGALQVANRVRWCLRAGRTAGIISGLAAIPFHICRHRNLRRPVSTETMRARAALRHNGTETALHICSLPYLLGDL